MENRMEALLEKIHHLENELLVEIQKNEQEFLYKIHEKKIHFERGIKARHRLLAKTLRRYFIESSLPTVLTAPVIWLCLFPALAMDLVLSFYQAVCFPIYGLPKVRRRDYIILDRRYLSYLNFIEKANCAYCGYFNGVVAYAREIAARTEQYWCPIKHARRVKSVHSRYKKFFDYGDAARYREQLETRRRDFKDIK